MVISAASAVDLAKDFNSDNFTINVFSGSNFTETVNISTSDIKLVVFENSGANSSDANSMVYFKDSTVDKTEITGFIRDLENEGTKIEETDKYVVLENNQKSVDFDGFNNLDGIFNFISSMFSSDGVNISSEGNTVSFSSNGLNVSDADGENVSITSEGVSVSGNESSDNETVNVSSDVSSNIENSQYSIYLKNQDNNKVIVLSGNNLELLKAMAETVTFNEN